MVKDIWHTADETPESCVNIAFYVDGYLYSDYYKSQYNQYGIFGADKVEKWCYMRELSSYVLALETELEHTRKALDVANEKLRHCVDITVEELDELKGNLLIAWNALLHFSKDPIANNALKKITALKQKDVK